jgi:hypothetical protein
LISVIRSICAVLAGIVALTVTSFAVEAAVNPILLRLFPRALPNPAAIAFNPYASLVTLVYTSLCIVAGGYVTAWIAKRAPVEHAIIMGVVQVLLTVMAMLHFRGMAPLRNWIATLILTIPVASLGGVLHARHFPSQAPAASHQDESDK